MSELREKLITVQTLKRMVAVDTDSGRIFWKERDISFFADGKQSAHQNCAAWNGKYAGKEAFLTDANGYRCGRIFQKQYPAHRIVYAVAHGRWPSGNIDHIDGDPKNNSVSNLRDVTQTENMQNCRIRSDNKSGCAGVSWHKARMKWHVRITDSGKTKSLGYFCDLEEAISTRRGAQKRLRFTDRHGAAAEALSAFGVQGGEA
tara:strand:- start:2904 stop:3512 length:609 start_codon:yes stop_codon:yes gene_type:complete